MASPPSSGRYRFGAFDLQLDERRLLKDDIPVALRPRAFDLLAALVGEAGHLVTKEQLLERVWPKVVVEEAAVHVQVSALRKIVGADAIATVSGRGYRFTLPVTKDEAGTVALSPKHNLPYQLTSFIGREQELAQLKDHLAKHRLVTLTGTGGCGKTRLAIEVAGQVLDTFADGVWMIELASLSDGQFVTQGVMQALGVKEQPEKSPLEVVTGYLASKELLLVIDNAEHVLEGCVTLIDQLLRHSAAVSVLVTSRERLGLVGELTYRVPSLTVPGTNEVPSPDHLLNYDGVRLFLDRVRLLRPHFKVTADNASAVASICSRLDGVPLAIELAAPRLRSMSVEELSQRLDHRFALLTDGSRAAVPRHRTLRSMIDWSYDLLTEAERTMLRRLAVFAGGWTLASAETVCSGDGIDTPEIMVLLASLADKSLIIVDEQDGVARHRILETVREYALDRLRETSDESTCRDRHFAAFFALAEESFGKLQGPEQRLWLTRLANEYDNLRAALAWSVASSREDGLLLPLYLGNFWRIRGPLSEGRQWCSRLLALSATESSRRNRAWLLHAAASLALAQCDYVAAEQMYLESLDLSRGIEERWTTYPIGGLAEVACARAQYAEAEPRARELVQIARATGDRLLLVWSLGLLGRAVQGRGDSAAGLEALNEALAVALETGDSFQFGAMLNLLARGECDAAKHDLAQAHFREAIKVSQQVGFLEGIAFALEGLASVALAANATFRAVRLWGSAEALRQQTSTAMTPAARTRYDTELASAKGKLSTDTFEQAWNEGRAMPLDETVRYALDDQ